MMKSLWTVIIAAVLVLPGCASSSKKPDRLCPQTAIIRELEQVKDFGQDTPDDKTLVATAKLKSVKGRCDYTDDGVDMGFDVAMVAGRGTRLGSDRISFPFFISVLDPEQKILTKELMTAEFAFGGDEKITSRTEDLHVFIPMDKDSDGANYQVLLGFQLTEEQLRAVRKSEDKTAR